MKKLLTLSILLALILLSGFLLVKTSYGYGVGDIGTFTEGTFSGTGLNKLDFPTLVGNIIRLLLGLVGAFFVVMIIYGGITWLTSQGAQDKVDKARKTLTYSVVGVIIILASYSIVNFVVTTIDSAPSGGLPPAIGNNSNYNSTGNRCEDVNGGSCILRSTCCVNDSTALAGPLTCEFGICQKGDTCFAFDGKEGCTDQGMTCCQHLVDPCSENCRSIIGCAPPCPEGCEWVPVPGKLGTCITR